MATSRRTRISTSLTDVTLADAILDRLVHNAHRIRLHGESLRKTAARAVAA